VLDTALEKAVEDAVQHGEHTSHISMHPQKVSELLSAAAKVSPAAGGSWTLLTSSGARYFVRQILEASFPQVAVLSHGEVPPGLRVVSLGVLKAGAA